MDPFEEFWKDKEDILEGVNKQTAEIIWNAAVVTSIHNIMSLFPEGKF